MLNILFLISHPLYRGHCGHCGPARWANGQKFQTGLQGAVPTRWISVYNGYHLQIVKRKCGFLLFCLFSSLDMLGDSVLRLGPIRQPSWRATAEFWRLGRNQPGPRASTLHQL